MSAIVGLPHDCVPFVGNFRVPKKLGNGCAEEKVEAEAQLHIASALK